MCRKQKQNTPSIFLGRNGSENGMERENNQEETRNNKQLMRILTLLLIYISIYILDPFLSKKPRVSNMSLVKYN